MASLAKFARLAASATSGAAPAVRPPGLLPTVSAISFACIQATYTRPSIVHAAGSGRDGGGSGNDKPPPAFDDWFIPVGESLTFGAISGFTAGYALKKVGRVATIAAGAVFCVFQVAARAEYVEVKWDKVRRDFEGALDLDGDGKMGAGDAQIALRSTVETLTRNMAATGAGFSGGFLMGIRRG